MKLILSSSMACAIGASVATTTSCNMNIFSKRNYIHIDGISFENDTIDIGISSDSLKLQPTISPINATNKSLIWDVNNENVDVSSFGIVTPKKIGKSIITCKTVDGGFDATCTINVQPNFIHVESIGYDDPAQKEVTLILSKKDSITLTPVIYPLDATNKQINWFSSNENIATVDRNGVVQAISTGNVLITAETVDGGHTCYSQVNVTSHIPTTGVHLTQHEIIIQNLNEKHQLFALVEPYDATNQNVTWKSTNKRVATVDENGYITPLDYGETIIRVKTEEGEFEDQCTVIVNFVYVHIKNISLSYNDFTFKLGDPDSQKTIDIVPTITPINATNKVIYWQSSNLNVATVENTGINTGHVIPVQNGEAIIIATTDDGSLVRICHIYVSVGYNVSLNITTASICRIIGSNIARFNEDYRCEFYLCDFAYDLAPSSLQVWINNFEIEVDQFTPWLTCDELIIPKDQITGDIVVNWNPVLWKTRKTITTWLGNVSVKCKLSYGHQLVFLSDKEDGEDGYDDNRNEREGGRPYYDDVLEIPDYVTQKIDDVSEKYYVTRIPYDWSDGDNGIEGVVFKTKHLKVIEERAFYETNALNYYIEAWKEFAIPEGVEIIGKQAFYGTDYGWDNVPGYCFPSTLRMIGDEAFQEAPYVESEKNGYMSFLSFPKLGKCVFSVNKSMSCKDVYFPIHINDSYYYDFLTNFSTNVQVLGKVHLYKFKLKINSYTTYQSDCEIPLTIKFVCDGQIDQEVTKCWTNFNPNNFILTPISKLPEGATISITKSDTYDNQVFCLQWKNFYSFDIYKFKIYNFDTTTSVGEFSFRVNRWSK